MIGLNSNSMFLPLQKDIESYIVYKQLCQTDRNIVVILKDEDSCEKFLKQIKFFINDSGIEIIKFPAWDSKPYDRLSPSIMVQTLRLSALYKLACSNKRKVIVTTIPALLLRVVDSNLIKNSTIRLSVGDSTDFSDLINKLSELGYQRSSTASDLGEFAVRGSIIDIIDNTNGRGFRIDFFGNKIDIIRTYDPITQLSQSSINEIIIFSASEVIIDTASREYFLEGYKNLSPSYFNDSIYQAVKEHRRYMGLEYWLPLFYEKLYSIDGLFKGFEYIFFDDPESAYNNFSREINNGYEQRKQYSGTKYSEDYVPIEPNLLWLGKEEFSEIISSQNANCFIWNKSKGNEDDNIRSVSSFLNLSALTKEDSFAMFQKYRKEYKNIVVIGCSSKGSLERLKSGLFERNIAYLEIEQFDQKTITSKSCVYLGFFHISSSFQVENIAFIAEQDLIHVKTQKNLSKAVDIEKIKSEISNYSIEDYIIHKTHGVGRYVGIVAIKVSENNHDCLKLIYDNNDILYLPVENVDFISKYKGSDENIKLDKLGSLGWQQTKAKVKNRIKEIALKLLEIAARRKTSSAPVYETRADEYNKFCDEFPYVETNDQLNAITDIEEDLKLGAPMDRLLCGDVGFGKTEVAMRAAFMVAASEVNPAQVVMIVPTTLLARQHYINFTKRFEKTSINIKQISRLVTSKEVKQIKNDLSDGQIDIIIGTHALLAGDIKFKNLGLLIIDEEQHFGVKQKEKIKELSTNCHVLTLSATPIPRTLQMSIVGIKDLSLLATPPVDRLAVKTYVIPYDRHIIREAILKEHERGGSIFYVTPRVEYIEAIISGLKELVPEVRIRAAHGKMKPSEIEDIMIDFYNRKFEVLVSTTIIESGIDLPFVNTMIIDRAEMFGLATLYQLRGRVGRDKIKAFAYLATNKSKINDEAKARLEVIRSLDHLGGGFSIASSDMDLRGFGNLLGEEQSGQIKEVGLELYQSMLSEAILNLKSNKKDVSDEFNPIINLGLPVFIPDNYIADVSTKLSIYRKASKLENYEQIDEFSDELIDRFGKFPLEVANFILTIKIKSECKKLNIEKIDIGEKAILIGFKDNLFKEPEKLLSYIGINPGIVRFRPDQKIILQRQFSKAEDRIEYLRQFLFVLHGLLAVE